MQLVSNVDLKPFNTMNVSANASSFVEVTDQQELSNWIASCRRNDTEPLLVLGGGSNMLLTSDFSGIVLRNQIKGVEIVEESDSEVHLKIGGGEDWHELVMHAVENGWGGIENLALIPGTVGAAPIQNIGAYGVELEQVFSSLEAVHLGTGEIREFRKEDCGFGYRNSVFKNELKGQYFISSVFLRLQKNPKVNTSYKALTDYLKEHDIQEPGIKDIAEAVIAVRQSKLPDPIETPNTGSFFKNPVVSSESFEALQNKFPDVPNYPAPDDQVKVPAGWLIEQAGWKGKRVGDVGTYPRQALVIVNYGEDSGQQILDFAVRVQEVVKQKFNIDLEMEVNILP